VVAAGLFVEGVVFGLYVDMVSCGGGVKKPGEEKRGAKGKPGTKGGPGPHKRRNGRDEEEGGGTGRGKGKRAIRATEGGARAKRRRKGARGGGEAKGRRGNRAGIGAAGKGYLSEKGQKKQNGEAGGGWAGGKGPQGADGYQKEKKNSREWFWGRERWPLVGKRGGGKFRLENKLIEKGV